MADFIPGRFGRDALLADGHDLLEDDRGGRGARGGGEGLPVVVGHVEEEVVAENYQACGR